MNATRLQGGKTRRLALDAALLCCALALSYLESIIPISLLIPLPGFKLGFANLAVIAAAFLISPIDAAVVSFSRVAISSLLFGTVPSFLFSLFGAILSFAAICVSKYLLTRFSGWIGISVLSATFHNIGQLTAALLILSSAGVMWYLPALLVSAAITGTISGVLLMALMPILSKVR